MTDSNNRLPDFDDVDWDSALAEWDDNGFAPEIATPTAHKAQARKAKSDFEEDVPTRNSPRLLVTPTPIPTAEPAESNATVVAAIPQELLRGAARGDPHRSARAGLGQLFARDSGRPPDLHREPITTRPPPHLESDSVVTSAVPLPSSEKPGPALLVPEERQFDPNEVTFILPKSELLATQPAVGPSIIPPRAAAVGLPPSMRARLAERASWLEADARARGQRHGRSRGLLAASELLAIAGNNAHAAELAIEARDNNPSSLLAHEQVRGFARHPDEALRAIDSELAAVEEPSIQLELQLAAADFATLACDTDASAHRLASALALSSTDVRAPVLLVAHALARGTSAPFIGLAGLQARVAQAMTHAFRLRGSDPVQDGDERLPNDALREARVALDVGDVARASSCIATLRSEPELSRGATWLAMALGAVHEATRSAAAAWLEELADPSNFPARRALVARAIELGDGARVARVLETDGGFTAADRAVLATLHGVAPAPSDIDALAEEMPALAAALTSLAPDGHTAGTARASVLLGRLLAAHPSPSALSAAVRAFGETAPPAVRLVSLEAASRAGQFGELYDALLAWPSKGSSAARDRAFAAGLLAERVGDPVRAQAAYKLAHRADPAAEAPLRALASLDSSIDLVVELTSVADEIGDGARGATLRLEAVARADSLEVPTRLELLERAHQADPSLGLAAFSAERIARRAGYTDEVLKWIREQPKDDPLEAAVHTVREALAGEPESVGPLLEPLHRAYPADAALRLLLERTDPTTLQDHAQWREARAKEASGAARTVLLLDAASLYEQGGHPDDALRLARRCLEDADADFARVLCNRLAAQDKDGLLRDLEAEVRGSSDPREPLERLAELDPSTALSRHQQILQTAPKYLPSLRFVEHALLGQAADHELAPVARAIAEALGLAGGSETAAHAELARQLGDNDSSLIALATSVPEPSLAALRALWNQDRPDPKAFLESTEKLTSRLSSPMDLAFLHVRAAQAALEINDPQSAQALLEQATQEDAGDIVAWEMLAKLRTNTAAAEAFEALARASAVKEHQCEAWYEAQRLWSEHDDEVHAIAALEALVQLDVAYRDAFQCLADLYRKRGAFADLATLLEQRRPNVTDPAERVLLDLERGSSLREAGLDVAARDAFEQVLAVQPDHPEALEALGDLYDSQGDYAHAEQAWVSLVRLLSTPDGQRMVYAKLGELYSHKAVNLARAEVALREVLKRTPEDVPTLERLAGVLARANDIAGAVQVQQDLLAKASTVDERRRRVIELATLYETANEPRKAEQEFEKARRASPTDVHLLQALAEFYVRHKQTPAFNILLDRASSDARRSIGAGRVVPAYFQVLQTAYALRGRQDAARVVEATHAAFEGRSVPLRGAEADALDPSLDSLLAPEAVSPALRTLLARTGDALDAAAGALDLRTLRAGSVPAEAQPLGTLVSRLSRDVTWHFSEDAPGPCIPITPAGLLFGPSMLKMPEQAQVFLVIRSLKLLQAHAAAFLRGTHVGQLVLGWLHAFNPTWQPEGVDLAALGEVARRVGASLPKNLEPDIALLALEVAGSVGTGAARTGQAVVAWANRVALLAVGDPQAALEALGANLSHSPEERAAWIVKTPEVRDLLAFSVTDAYGEARSKLGLDH